MLHFTKEYYVHDNELYKKIKPCNNRYFLTNNKGKRQWITMKKILEIIDNKKTK